MPRPSSYPLFPLLVFMVACSCSRESPSSSRPAAPKPTRQQIWQAIQPRAERYRIDPAFVYALVAAESNFDPRARNGDARGLLQIKPRAWKTVSALPYEPTVWDWRANLEIGIDYLTYTRSYLHQKNKFSYPLLLAAFHYGIDYVEARDFNLKRIDVPDNDLYRELWKGNLAPIAPP